MNGAQLKQELSKMNSLQRKKVLEDIRRKHPDFLHHEGDYRYIDDDFLLDDAVVGAVLSTFDFGLSDDFDGFGGGDSGGGGIS